MNKNEILDYLRDFAKKVNAPTLMNTTVNRVSGDYDSGYLLETSSGDISSDQVVIASGSYPVPIIPRMSEKIPPHIHQLHSEEYKNSQQLSDGAVLVVGSGACNRRFSSVRAFLPRKRCCAMVI